ncbi:hypothetical protein H0H92_004575 [Tricholoma furcatifolium]|nr:hypothetical protein H0H92_004575 [Tricholoma furcatifolium]
MRDAHVFQMLAHLRQVYFNLDFEFNRAFNAETSDCKDLYSIPHDDITTLLRFAFSTSKFASLFPAPHTLISPRSLMNQDPFAGVARRYEADDLLGLSREQLLELVNAQPNCWPDEIKLNSKTNKSALRDVLLDPRNGFTTKEPRKQAGPTLVEDAHELAQPIPLDPQADFFGPHILLQANNFLDGGLAVREEVLRVYLCDQHVSPSVMSTADLIVNMEAIFSQTHLGGWSLTAAELLNKLQSSNIKITGSGHVKVGTADEVHTEYTRFFLDAMVPRLCEAVAPIVIVVPYPVHAALPSVTVRVLKADTVDSDKSIISHTSINELESPSSTPPHASGKLTKHQSRSIAKLLVAIAKSRPGFTELYRTKGHDIQNSQIVDNWCFIAQFWGEYFKQDCAIVSSDIAVQGKLIPAACIYAALHHQGTVINQALEGDHRVRRFTMGPEYRAEVAQEIDAERHPPHRRLRLLEFL